MTIQDIERRSYSAQLALRAASDAGAIAVVLVSPDGVEREVTVGELESRCNRAAWHLLRSGIGPHSLVVVALTNGATHLATTLAAWRLGACVLPMNPRLPAVEQRTILEVAASWRPPYVVGPDDAIGHVDATASELEDAVDEGRIPDRTPHPGKAIGSGGSTGRPKIIVDPAPWTRAPGDFSSFTERPKAAPVFFLAPPTPPLGPSSGSLRKSRSHGLMPKSFPPHGEQGSPSRSPSPITLKPTPPWGP
jgi:bile acid-coenzyme A ligase